MLKKIILLLSLSLWIFFVNFSYGDALDDVLWNSSEAWQYQIVTANKNNLQVSKKVHNTAKLLLNITIIIWVAVVLFGGIRFMMSMWDDSKAKKVRDNLIISIIWFIIAFWAWVILQLILSVWTTIVKWS